MKNKKEITIIAVVLITIALAFLFLYFYSDDSQNKEKDVAELIALAEEEIMRSYEYGIYPEPILINIESRKLDCLDCWEFIYMLGVDRGDGKIDEEKGEYKFYITIIEGRINNTEISEIKKIEKHPPVYCKPEERGTDFCIMLYAPVCGFFYEPSFSKTYSNSCVACQDPKVEYWIEGEC